MDLSALILECGLWAVFLFVLMEQFGLPLPAVPLLLIVGAAAATDPGFGLAALLVATLASVAGGAVMFAGGRRHGGAMLHFFCRISLSPKSCIDNGLAALDRFGPVALLMARFVPGLSAMAPALAGKAGMRVRIFLASQTLAAALFAAAAIGAGHTFHDAIDPLVCTLSAYAKQVGIFTLAAIAAWLIYVVIMKRRRER